jgi:glyoxylase-like metal-dependent hydrolase (beta-lactamase superfamily II)
MIKVGKVTITPLFEAPGDAIIQACVAEATPGAVREIEWLQPHYVDEQGRLKGQLQSFLIETESQKIVVDTGAGNGRNRPELAEWSNLNTDYLERLSQVFLPEEAGIVLCTHMHSDHVGWNTKLVNGEYIPTFPNAQYIFVEDEFNYWKNNPAGEIADDLAAIAESVLPIYEAGLAKLVPNDFRVCDEVSFISTPGHTPGHVSILIESEGQSAVISGDALHHTCQIAHPEWKSVDTDSELANKSRRTLLERFAGTDTLFIGSHFTEPMAGKIVRDNEKFKFAIDQSGLT